MERIGEMRKQKTASGDRRRHGADDLPDSPEREVEFHDTVRSRDREIRIRNKQRIDEFLEISEECVIGEEDGETMAVDEIICVAVPRKALSSCAAKRSDEYCVSMNVSSSPARLSGEAAVLPPRSNRYARKKMKGAVNFSRLSQEDFEIEMVEVLCGLMNQSQSSNKKKLESKNLNGVGNDENEQLDLRQVSQPKFTGEKCEASLGGVPLMSIELREEAVEPEYSRNLTNETDNVEGMGRKKATVSSKEELLLCPNLDIHLQDSTMTKGNSTSLDIKNQEEEIRINGKALERDGLVDLRLGPDHMAQNGDKKNATVVAEKLTVRNCDTKRKLLVIDLEKEYPDHGSDGGNAGIIDLEDGRQKQQRTTLSKEKKTAQPGSKPAGMASDGNTGTSKAPQFLGMNKFYTAPAGSSLIYGASPCSLNLTLPTTPSQGISMATNVKSTCGVKDKSSDAVFLQNPQPPNLPHGPAFFVPLTQNQVPLPTSATQSGTSKSSISINNPSSSSNSASRAPVASTLTYNYPNMVSNEAPPRSALLQNNAYTLPISNPFGSAPAFIGGAPPPHAMPFFNGSFYPPQMFHPSQPVVLPAPTGSTSSSSPSQRKPQVGIGSNGGNRVEKQQHRFQDQSSNGGVEINELPHLATSFPLPRAPRSKQRPDRPFWLVEEELWGNSIFSG